MFPISFTAYHKNTTTVKFKNGENCPANIVELEQNKQDLDTLKQLSLLWSKQSGNFLPYLVSDYVANFGDDAGDKHCLAVTLQEDNFDRLDPQKILGVSLVSKEGRNNMISWFQVEPQNCFSSKSKNKKYKQAGHSLLSYIINEYGEMPIQVASSSRALSFYKKHGFVALNENRPYILCYNA